MALDPVQVLPLLNALNSKDGALIKQIYNNTIYIYNKPSVEDEELYTNETLKQRCLIDADWAISTFNLSNIDNGYQMGNNEITNIKIPILHILGDTDYMVPEVMLDHNVNATKEYSKVIRYDKCAHSPFIDKPIELRNDILDFLFS